MRVAILGEIGSFHDAATQQFFDHPVQIIPCTTFRGAFAALRDDTADIAIVAVENSLYGSIHETYDQLLQHDFTIIGEVQLHIHQQLIAPPGVAMDDITEIISHPAAIDQCRKFIAERLPHATVREHADTAGAVAEIATKQLSRSAAIASRTAATLHQMTILAEDIEDEADNITRFLVISPHPEPIPAANKASIILTTDHTPGALYRALGVFDQYHTNLTKLESRSVRGRPFEYQFILDVLADQSQLITLVHELEQLGYTAQLLGHYCTFQ